MNYDLYHELKQLADTPNSPVDKESKLSYNCGVRDGMVLMARKVLNAYAYDNGKKPAPYKED